MKFIVWSLSIMSALCSCMGQQKKDKIVLQIINRSSVPIDSINISHADLKIKEKIDQATTIEVDVPKAFPSEEGPLLMFIYQGAHFFKASWGFCDFGSCVANNKPIYVFDHGINYEDVPPVMPEEFILYVNNMTDKNIDSIYSESAAIIQEIRSFKK